MSQSVIEIIPYLRAGIFVVGVIGGSIFGLLLLDR